ncbi:unnamed protein product [Haemonchus placei]|uniref:Secreted protein n=1 Tax=Haemonchus placei TaxID=6290 RepID=A0A0N4WDW4_HAEPC|nr:unnamed protein product [Haemonchus placei]
MYPSSQISILRNRSPPSVLVVGTCCAIPCYAVLHLYRVNACIHDDLICLPSSAVANPLGQPAKDNRQQLDLATHGSSCHRLCRLAEGNAPHGPTERN